MLIQKNKHEVTNMVSTHFGCRLLFYFWSCQQRKSIQLYPQQHHSDSLASQLDQSLSMEIKISTNEGKYFYSDEKLSESFYLNEIYTKIVNFNSIFT